MVTPATFFAVRRGLTLLELLVVILIMAAIAGAAVTLTDNLDSQTRYDDTVTRLNAIRYGIVGDSRPQSDGRRLMSGFVADMGRLPTSLDELILSHDEMMAKYGAAPAIYQRHGQPVFYDPTPTDVSNGDETRLSDYEFTGSIPGWWKGFRGPYVPGATWQKRIDNSVQQKRFRDGWGTRMSNPSMDDNDANHGWMIKWLPTGNNTWSYSYPTSSPLDAMMVRSYGSDGLVGTTTTDRYAEDVPPLSTTFDTRTGDPPSIKPEDWTVAASMFTIDVRSSSGSVDNVQVAWLYYRDLSTVSPTAQWPWARIDSMDNGTAGQPVGIGGKPFTFDNDPLPCGPQLVVVFTDMDNIFDDVILKSVRLIDAFPRASSTTYQITIDP